MAKLGLKSLPINSGQGFFFFPPLGNKYPELSVLASAFLPWGIAEIPERQIKPLRTNPSRAGANTCAPSACWARHGVCTGGQHWGGVHFARVRGRVATPETTVSRDTARAGRVALLPRRLPGCTRPEFPAPSTQGPLTHRPSRPHLKLQLFGARGL